MMGGGLMGSHDSVSEGGEAGEGRGDWQKEREGEWGGAPRGWKRVE